MFRGFNERTRADDKLTFPTRTEIRRAIPRYPTQRTSITSNELVALFKARVYPGTLSHNEVTVRSVRRTFRGRQVDIIY